MMKKKRGFTNPRVAGKCHRPGTIPLLRPGQIHQTYFNVLILCVTSKEDAAFSD